MDSRNSSLKWTSLSVPVLSLIVAALSLILSIVLAVRGGQLANLYLALDLQQKRPFLAPVIHSIKEEVGERYRWSWGAKNSGAVIAKLLYSDNRKKRFPNGPWSGSIMVRDEIIYPGETLELLGHFGKPSVLAVTCIVYEEVRDSGERRRWAGFAQYFFTEAFDRLTRSGFDPDMQLVHRTEKSIAPEITTCDAADWWSKLPTVSTGKSYSNTAKQ